MALDRLVDNTKLNTALTATANAIRAKTGDNSQINFDYTTDTGFASAIEEITSGGIDTSDATATAGDILNGKTAYVNGEKITGNIVSKSSSDLTSSDNTVTVPAGYYSSQATKTVGTAKAAATYNTSTSDQSIAAGQYLTGAQTIKAVTTSNISAGNIKVGVNVKVGDANSAGRIKNITGTFDGFITSRAVIHVIAPSGSTVVFKKGSTTMKTVSSSDALPNNNDSTMQDYYCSVASGDYGSWTITATLGTDTESDTVTISTNKQYDIVLSYRVPLYYEGTYYNNLSGGFVTTQRRYDAGSAAGKNPTITNNTTYFRFYIDTGGGTYQTANKIDLTNFNVLRISAKGYVKDANLRVGADTGATYWANSFVAFASVNGNSAPNRATFNIDISALSGQYYITFGASYMNGTVYGDIYEVALIK